MKSKFSILFLFWTIILPVFPAVDSTALILFQHYEKSSGNERIEAANQFMETLYKNRFIDKVTRFTRETPKDTIQKKVFLAVSEFCFYELQDFSRTFDYGKRAATLANRAGDLSVEGDCQSLLAVAYFRRGDYVHALKHAHRDLEIQRNIGHISNMSSSLNTLAGIYLASRQYDESYKYIMAAIPLSTKAKDSTRMAIQMGMAAEILQAMHRSEEAINYAHRAYELDSIRGNKAKAAIRLSQLASALMDLNRNDEAERALHLALPELEADGNRYSLAISHNQLGELMNRRKAYRLATSQFEQSLPFFYKVGDKYNEAKARKGLYMALRESDPRVAMKHLERFSDLKDSLYSQEMKHDLSLAHAKYHNEELEKQNEQERKVKTLTLIMSIAVVLSLLVLLGFVIFALRSRKRRLLLMHHLQEEKEQFFTHITHEFRTPLTIILGLVSRLKENRLSEDETVVGVASIIERQGQTLLELVNQLLDMARTRRVSVKADYHQDDIVGYIHMVVESCNELARQKHIDLQYVPAETRLFMRFIPDYLLKILQNLIANAVKFTGEYGKIRLTSELSSNKKHFIIVVSDNGKGISSDLLPYIFETFVGSKGTEGEVSTGVGLALVKKLVESMEGTIEVDSHAGQGSSFRVLLPYYKSDEGCYQSARVTDLPSSLRPVQVETDNMETHSVPVVCSAESMSDNGNSSVTNDCQTSQYTILVVEDNDDIYYYIEHVLRSDYYIIQHARNGEEGLEQAQAIVPDLIITDVMMPLMDGFEMCRQLKDSQVTNHIPVIVVTARCTEADKLHGLNCGVESYLYKPFSAEELLTRIRNIFEQRRIWREKFMKQSVEVEPRAKTDEEHCPVEDLFLKKVNDYINAHMAEGAIGVDELASHMCMSAKQLNRKLPAIVGYSVTAYISRLRVSRACHLLKTSTERVGTVAQQCGFDNPSNFTRTFRECIGCSPSLWRKSHSEE